MKKKVTKSVKGKRRRDIMYLLVEWLEGEKDYHLRLDIGGHIRKQVIEVSFFITEKQLRKMVKVLQRALKKKRLGLYDKVNGKRIAWYSTETVDAEI